MARKSRIDYAGARYHVINRGVEVSALEQYRESSFASLWYPSRRHLKKPASKEWRLLKNMGNWTDPISGPHL